MFPRTENEKLLLRIEELQAQLAGCMEGWTGGGRAVDFRHLAERSMDAIYHYDLDKKDFLYINRPFCVFFDLERGKIHETSMSVIMGRIHAEERDRVIQAKRASLAQGTTGGEAEYRIEVEGRPVRYVDDRWIVLRDGEGRARAIEGFIRDITASRMADEALEATKRHALIGNYIVQDRKLVYVNPEFVRITGYSAEELKDMNPLLIVHEDFREHVRQNAVKVLRGERTDPYEFCAVTKDGRIRWVMENVTAIQYRGRRAALGYFMDITNLREARQNLVSLGLMVGAVSHSLKGCLTGLEAALYLIDTGFYREAPARIEEGLETARMMVDRVGKLVYDVLYYVKERDLELETIDVLQFANDVATSVANRMRGADIRFSCRFSPPLGSFEIDRDLLRPALINILDNAMEACIEDMEITEHTIELAVTGEKDEVVIDITDDGPGLDEEQMKNAFRLFYSSKGKKGTGLGLFITRKVIQQHGGSIGIQSGDGQGTTFRVRLPRKSGSAAG